MNNFYHYQPHSIEPLTDTIVRLRLRARGSQLPYQAGQYVEIHLADSDHRPYSIANAPIGNEYLEFHIRHGGDDPFPDHIIAACRSQQSLHLTGPFGECCLPAPNDKPLLFVAAGTGFAPHKALIEECLLQNQHPAIHLFWGAKTQSDLYLESLAEQWAKHNQQFEFTPVVSQEDNATSQSPTLLETVKNTYPNLANHRVYAAGPFALVNDAKAMFLACGLAADDFYSDV